MAKRPYNKEENEILDLTSDEQLAYNEYMKGLRAQKAKKKSKNKQAKKARKRNKK